MIDTMIESSPMNGRSWARIINVDDLHESSPLFKADKSIEDRARGATFVVTWGQGQVEARIVERRRPQSSHWSTKTVRCVIIGWG